MAHKLTILLTIFGALLLFVPLAYSGKKSPTSRIERVSFGDIQFTAGEISANGPYFLEFTRKGEILFRGECAFKIHGSRILPGMPYPPCRSLLAYCFSGGAHCCMTAIIATECGPQINLSSIDLGHSDQEVLIVKEEQQTGKKIKVTDWQFAYYSLEGTEFLLSFADSPGMTRLLLFDNGRWRVDRAGEFRRFYSDLYKKNLHAVQHAVKKRADQETISAIAIRATYYAIMAGTPIEEATDTLRKLLPQRWSTEAIRIMADVKRAVYEFNPVEKLP